MNTLNLQAIRSGALGALVFAALIFIPAGTLDYWQGWAFLAVFIGASAAVTVYLAEHDPKLLERRMKGGPTAEKEPTQKIIMTLAMLGFAALLVVPAFDRRFGWSSVPLFVCLLGDALIVLGFYLVHVVMKANTYAATTIQIAEGQQLISTGPYAIVRHPMYAGALPLVLGVPLALGSWWGMLVLIPFMPALLWRLLDEENFLVKNLAGYVEYKKRVRYRLIPFVW